MFGSSDSQTIIAQCTPQGKGALALIRICGENALETASAISSLSDKQVLTQVPSHTIHYGSIHNKTHVIDQVLFFVMHAPKTFTGDNTVEITCHNNQFIVQSIIACAITHGARLAQPGEFTKRAVINNKIDLIQAEAINELIHANSQQALKLSLSQLKGSLSQQISHVEETLIKALAITEASFEFVDDDLAIDFTQQIQELILSAYTHVQKLVQQFSQQKQIRQGVKIACIGSVNVGKSSLFNALIGTDRAIVTEIAGTTRDTIESGLYANGIYWTLVDTAGFRDTTDIIEQRGIERSHTQAEQADIVLLVFDSSKTISLNENTRYRNLIDQHQKKIIGVFNKYDLNKTSAYQEYTIPILSVSAKTGYHIDLLHKSIEKKIEEITHKDQSPFLLNQRQANILLSVAQELDAILKMIAKNPEYELLAVHIKETLIFLVELTGKNITEKALNAVFKEFCIGK